jgi:hypothetical protein
MGMDLVRVINSVRDDLKSLYKKDPSAVWDVPFVVIGYDSGNIGYLDGNRRDEDIAEWLRAAREKHRIEAVVIGRMVVKHGKTLDSTGKPVVKERAIMVIGRDLSTGRSRLSITPCFEKRDYRSKQSRESNTGIFDPGNSSPDVTKPILNAYGADVGTLTATFKKETILDSRQGQKFLLDPIIDGLVETPRGSA